MISAGHAPIPKPNEDEQRQMLLLDVQLNRVAPAPGDLDPDELRRRFVAVEMFPQESYWTPSGESRARRAGQVGKAVCSIHFRHSAGYEIVLQFPDGKLDSFNPQMLFPAKKP